MNHIANITDNNGYPIWRKPGDGKPGTIDGYAYKEEIMTKFEMVRNTLKELIETELPSILQEENKRHNGGLLMENLSGVSFGEVLPLPYVKVTIKSGEHTEKDRIVKNMVYEVELEIVLQKNADYEVLLARYGEAFEKFAERFATVEGAWEWFEARLINLHCIYLVVWV